MSDSSAGLVDEAGAQAVRAEETPDDGLDTDGGSVRRDVASSPPLAARSGKDPAGTPTPEPREEAARPSAPAAPSREDAFRIASARIMTAHAADDPFAVLSLPPPTVDALGRPRWECSSSEISRAYRKASLAVHPDRHEGRTEARDAFEAVEAARRRLEDPDALERLLLSRSASAAAELSRGATGEGASLCATSADRARKADEILEAQARELRESVFEAAQARVRAVEQARQRRKAMGEQDDDQAIWEEGRAQERVASEKGSTMAGCAAGAKRPRGTFGPSLADPSEATGATAHKAPIEVRDVLRSSNNARNVTPSGAPRVEGNDDAAAAARRKATARRRRGGGGARAWTSATQGS